MRFARWLEAGVYGRGWWRITTAFRTLGNGNSSIHVHPHETGAAKKVAQAIGRIRDKRTSKLHLSCDENGNALN